MADRRVALSCALISVFFVPLVAFGIVSPEKQDRFTRALTSSTAPDAAQFALPALQAQKPMADEAAAASVDHAESEPAADTAPAEATRIDDDAARDATEEDEQESKPDRHLLDDNQLVVFYGSPLASGLGILGMFEPEDAAQRVRQQAQIFDEINGERGAIGAMDLIYGMAMSEPTANGKYVSYLKDDVVERYIALAEKHDLQVILDLQIGRAAIPDEVRKIERFLVNPRVHVAIDPEYAVGPSGAPIHTPGRMSGHEMNEVQDYLAALVEEHDLPPKMMVVHQYLNNTITDGEATREVDGVDIVLNMDGFGEIAEKQKKYHYFSERPYAHRDSFNIFLKQDERVMSEQEVLDLAPLPDAIFYQ
jgi:hypothetical protein